MKYDVRVLIEAEAEVGEGPVIDPRTGKLCWVDIPAGHLFQSALITGDTERWTMGMSLGAVAPRANHDGFAVAVAQVFGFAYLAGGAFAAECCGSAPRLCRVAGGCDVALVAP